jgi:hypothetical protein
MEMPSEVALALDRTIVPGALVEEARDTAEQLEVALIFTTAVATLSALRRAGTLAADRGARVTLLVPQIVPHPLPLESPPVLLDFNERRFRQFAAESPVEISVRIYLCRDAAEALRLMLKPHSMVVVGGPDGWWPSREKRLARSLRRAGHQVVFLPEE